jgi:inner membrane protein
MDVVSHAALGLTIGHCGLAQRIGRGGKWLALAGGTLPDLDVVMGWGDPWAGIAHHRHLTHSLLVQPIVALALAGLWWRFGRCKRYGLLWACAAATLTGHVLLDWCTSYGTTLLAPLSNHRFALDWIGIVDPFYTGILIAGLLVCWRRSARGAVGRARSAAVVGLALSTAYVGLGGTQHALAIRLIDAEAAAAGQRPQRVGAYPQIGSVFLWRLVYCTDQAYYVARVNMLRGGRPEFVVAPISHGQLVDAAAGDPKVRLFRWFARGMVRPERRVIDGQEVVVWHDMRYAWPGGGTTSLWAAVVWFDKDSHIEKVTWARPGWSRLERLSLHH